MSYTLIRRQLQKARKAHRCIWCGESIPAGTMYEYERSVYNDEPQSHHWHPECSEFFSEHIDDYDGEFCPHDNERPVPSAEMERT